MTGDRPPPRIGSLANLLGIARILATPVIIALILVGSPGLGIVAVVLFFVAGMTDFFDGWVARARGEVSPLGVFMDLTADKVLVGGVLIAMVEVDLLPTWIVATILVRELVIGGVRQMAAAENVVIAAKPLGKAKTLTTLLGMGALLIAYDALTGGLLAATGIGEGVELIGFWLMVIATALTSRRTRCQIRCAVCRCLRGALRSASRIASMKGMAAASFRRARAGTFRSGGTALATASRTIRRCTPNLRATPLIVPAPCSYSRRISSYSSTLFLLSKTTSVFSFSC